MTRPDLDALEKLADEATPGEWRRAIYSRERVIVAGPTSKAFMKVLSKPPHSNGKDCLIQDDANAAFILGVQPATIKALIAEVRSLRTRVARWEPPMMTSTASSSCSTFLARNGKPTRARTKAD